MPLMERKPETRDFDIVTARAEDLDRLGLCGANPLGVARKREWLRRCLPTGVRYKNALDRATGKALGLIEYAPAETAWRAVSAPEYFIIHCLFVPHANGGRGIGSVLLDACVDDARRHGQVGVAAIATTKGWCADSRIFVKHGFRVVDHAEPGLELLALNLRPGPTPTFGDWRRRAAALAPGVHLFVSAQCPFMRIERTRARQQWIQKEFGVPATVVEGADAAGAQANPSAWGTAGTVCNGTVINYVQGGDAHLRKGLRRLLSSSRPAV